jgi:hypothetical protein
MAVSFAAGASGKRRRLLAHLLWSAIVCVACMAGLPTVDAGQASEADVKAAFILSFLKFVEWPASRVPPAGGAFIIVVMGDDAVLAALTRTTTTEHVLERAVSIRSTHGPEGLGDAHLVFITGSARQRLPAVLRELEGKGVLTVGDTPGYAQSGVVLNLFVQDDRVKFEANTTAAARAGLRLSSHLLRVARIVG